MITGWNQCAVSTSGLCSLYFQEIKEVKTRLSKGVLIPHTPMADNVCPPSGPGWRPPLVTRKASGVRPVCLWAGRALAPAVSTRVASEVFSPTLPLGFYIACSVYKPGASYLRKDPRNFGTSAVPLSLLLVETLGPPSSIPSLAPAPGSALAQVSTQMFLLQTCS